MPIRSELLFACLLCIACDSGPADPQAACAAIAHAWCQRVWDLSAQGCVDAQGIAASFASEQQCEVDFEVDLGNGQARCDEVSCGSKGFSPSHASDCASTVGSVACTPAISLGSSALSCQYVCCSQPGESVGAAYECCSSNAHDAPSSGCTLSYGTPSLICD